MRKYFVFLLLLLFIATPQLLFAADEERAGEVREKPATGIGEAADVAGIIAGGAGYAPNPPKPATIVGTIISFLLGVVGVIFMVQTIIAGFRWMTAGGNEEDVKKAKTALTNSVIGLAIVLGAWVIYNTIAGILGIG